METDIDYNCDYILQVAVSIHYESKIQKSVYKQGKSYGRITILQLSRSRSNKPN